MTETFTCGDAIDQDGLYLSPGNTNKIYPKKFYSNVTSYFATVFLSANSYDFQKGIMHEDYGPQIKGAFSGRDYQFKLEKQYNDAIINDFSVTHNSRILCDVILEVGDKVFYANSLVLMARSKFLTELILKHRYSFQEREKTGQYFRGVACVFELPKKFESAVGYVLEWLHTGRLIVPKQLSCKTATGEKIEPANFEATKILAIIRLFQLDLETMFDNSSDTCFKKICESAKLKWQVSSDWRANVSESAPNSSPQKWYYVDIMDVEEALEDEEDEDKMVEIKFVKHDVRHLVNGGGLSETQRDELDNKTLNAKPNPYQKWNFKRNKFLQKVITISNATKKIKENFPQKFVKSSKTSEKTVADFIKTESGSTPPVDSDSATQKSSPAKTASIQEFTVGEKFLAECQDKNRDPIITDRHPDDVKVLSNFPASFHESLNLYIAQVYRYANTNDLSSCIQNDEQKLKFAQTCRNICDIIIELESLDKTQKRRIYCLSGCLNKVQYFLNFFAEDRWFLHQKIGKAASTACILKLKMDFTNIKYFDSIGVLFRYFHVGKFMLPREIRSDGTKIKSIASAIQHLSQKELSDNDMKRMTNGHFEGILKNLDEEIKQKNEMEKQTGRVKQIFNHPILERIDCGQQFKMEVENLDQNVLDYVHELMEKEKIRRAELARKNQPQKKRKQSQQVQANVSAGGKKKKNFVAGSNQGMQNWAGPMQSPNNFMWTPINQMTMANMPMNIQQMNLQMQHMQNMMQNFAAKQAENSKAAVQKK